MQNLTADFSERLVPLRHRDSARKLDALFAISLFLLSAAHRAQAAEPVKIPMTPDRWTTTAGTVNFIEHMGKPSIELKAGNYAEHINSGEGNAQWHKLSQRDYRV